MQTVYLLSHSQHTAWAVCDDTDDSKSLCVEDFLNIIHIQGMICEIEHVRHLAREIAIDSWIFASNSKFNVELVRCDIVPYEYKLEWAFWKYGRDINDWVR